MRWDRRATLAISRFLLGDWDAALEEGQRIRERFGDNPPGFLRVARGVTEYVLSSRGQFADAAPLRDLQMATPMRLAFRALGLAAEGRLDEAWEQFPLARLTIGVAFELQAKARLLQMAARWDELAELCAVDPRAIASGSTGGSGRRWPTAARRRSPWQTARRRARRSSCAAPPTGTPPPARSGRPRCHGSTWPRRWPRRACLPRCPACSPRPSRPLRRAGALAELARWDDLHGRYGAGS